MRAMSSSDSGSEKCSRSTSITRSTARACVARVIECAVAAATRVACSSGIALERLAKLGGDKRWREGSVRAQHASHLLLATRHALAERAHAMIVEGHVDPVVREAREPHLDAHLVERAQLREVFA